MGVIGRPFLEFQAPPPLIIFVFCMHLLEVQVTGCGSSKAPQEVW